MKLLKRSIIGIVILIILIILAIVIFAKKKNEPDLKIGEPIIETETIEEDLENEYQIQRLEYNAIKTVINKYIKSSNGGNVVIDNMEEKIKQLEEQKTFLPVRMKKMTNNSVLTYVVQGVTQDFDYRLDEEMCLIVNIDYSNLTFTIEPSNQDYDEITEVKQLNQIEKNDNNQFKNIVQNEEQIVSDYINLYKRYALGNPQIAYNYFDEEYRDKRFESIENYKAYVENNEEEIRSLEGYQYQVNNYEGYTQYVCKDKYENVYIFNEESIMNFTIQLDTYTIPTEKFIDNYEKAEADKKVRMNIDKWIQMLNNRDYVSAYNVLDEMYRENNFRSIKEFETTMKKNLPLHYKVEYKESSEENGTYMQRIVLSDITGEDGKSLHIDVIMQLKNNYEFVMSFGFIEEDEIE